MLLIGQRQAGSSNLISTLLQLLRCFSPQLTKSEGSKGILWLLSVRVKVWRYMPQQLRRLRQKYSKFQAGLELYYSKTRLK